MLRQSYIEQITRAFKVNPIVAILGPRQCGKTTLAQMYAKQIDECPEENIFDLENFTDLERLKDPLLALSSLTGMIVVDEVQRVPELFMHLRVLVDHPANKKNFLILGSASRELIKQSSESLAGRISYIELTPFNYSETKELEKLWLRGGFPRSYLSDDDDLSFCWRRDYIRTFLEQDIPALGIQIASGNLRRFWMMLAHYHGQVFNASEIGRSIGLSYNTVSHYLDILSNTFMVRQLQPWYENISKRQVKSQKIYFRDSGILHTLMGIDSKQKLLLHPKLGALWEGFAIEEVIRVLRAEQVECYFWATQAHAELDLLIVRGEERLGFEFKHTSAPNLTRSMKIAMEDLKLDKLIVIYPGNKNFSLYNKIDVVGLTSFLER